MKTVITIVIFSTISVSCKNNDCKYYCNYSFEDIKKLALNKKRTFCIILYDSLYCTPQNHIEQLSRNMPIKNVIFDYIEYNHHYAKNLIKVLYPHSFPVTCVFSYCGEIIDLIPGNSIESNLYIKNAIKNLSMNSDFHYNGKYGTKKENIIELYNKVLKIDNLIKSGHSATSLLDSINDSLMYPYLCYQNMYNNLLLKDSVSAQYYAKILSESQSAFYLTIYKEEIYHANRLLDPDYNEITAPSIQIDKKSIQLNNCKKDSIIPLIVKLKNTGHKTLYIHNIITSCSCIDLISDIREYFVYPKDSILIGFYFTPDKEGFMNREILFISNSYDNPVSRVTINAQVSE